MNRFFHRVIEPSLKCIPVLKVIHSENHNGRECRLAQTIHRNVYTKFDHRLSRYLAATRGEPFPAFTVAVEVTDAQSAGRVNRLAATFHDSVPHALMDLAERAVARAGPVELTLTRSASDGEDASSVSHRRKVAEGEIEMLRTALAVCRELGDGEFLEISGDFGVVVASPPGNLNPVIMHLQNGTVLVPNTPVGKSTPLTWPICAFAEYASTNPAALSYMASVGQALVSEKEAAIMEFRASAEKQIVDFHQALAGGPLEGYWLTAAEGLVARLRAGLGDKLVGISANAQGIAMDLSAEVGQLEGFEMDAARSESGNTGNLRLTRTSEAGREKA